MSNLSDLVYGHDFDHDDVLRAMTENHFGGWLDDSMPFDQLFALVWLDKHYNVHREDDYVLIAPGYAMWMIPVMTFHDPALLALKNKVDAMETPYLEDPIVQAFEARLTSAPFQVSFDEQLVGRVPDFMTGEMIFVQLMTELQSISGLEAMTTVRANGDVIRLPLGVTNVNEL